MSYINKTKLVFVFGKLVFFYNIKLKDKLCLGALRKKLLKLGTQKLWFSVEVCFGENIYCFG